MCVCAQVCTCVHMCAHMCVCWCVYMSIHPSICVICLCILALFQNKAQLYLQYDREVVFEGLLLWCVKMRVNDLIRCVNFPFSERQV